MNYSLSRASSQPVYFDKSKDNFYSNESLHGKEFIDNSHFDALTREYIAYFLQKWQMTECDDVCDDE